MKISCYLLDVTYKVINGKARIHLWCRTKTGERVCLVDDSFEPYFYVLPSADVTAELLNSRVEQDKNVFFVTRIEEVKKNVVEKPVELLKIFVNIPKGVPVIKDEARKINGVKECFEFDILFTRRYLIDKCIMPLQLVEAEGDEIACESVRTVRISSIKSVLDTLSEPKIVAVDIETYYDGFDKRILPSQNPILMIAVYGGAVKKVLTWKRFSTKDSDIEFCQSEADMLVRFVSLIKEESPDIIAGYYSDGFDFPYVKKRAEINKVLLDVGVDSSELRITGRAITQAEITGVVHVDVFKFIRKVIGRSMATDVFTLDAVAKELLGDHKHAVDLNVLGVAWNNGDESLEKFCAYNRHDAKLTFDLCVKILPNMMEFVKIVGALLFDVNRMSFSQLVEAYIIKKAASAGEIAPNKPYYTEKQARMADKIKGAFVFEPTPGFYENIAVFDYRSLYPSIIASHNISPGTQNCVCCEGKEGIKTERGTFWFCDKKKGFLSLIIGELISLRAGIKAQIKEGKRDALTLARSEALKVLANSFYGYLGFYVARWYCKECAESTTAFGRQYIHNVIDTAQADGFKVLYSDTDSVFLLLEKHSKEDALRFMKKINDSLPGVMELDFEGLYAAGIFVSAKATELGAKKKYALIDENGVLKIKGFETVRRNWSLIAKDVQKRVLEIILKEKKPAKAVEFVRGIVADCAKGMVPVEKLIIHTQLQREIGAYKSIGPHVVVAQRMQNKGMVVEPGMIIEFVVIKGGGKIGDRVRLPSEAKQSECDGSYYVLNQILPSVERIFSVLGYKKDDLISQHVQKSLAGFG